MSIQTEELTADYTGMITEADYQEYLRFDGTDQATVMPMLVESAIRQAEAYCNASFGNKSYEYQRQVYTSGCNYYLPYAPIRTVTAVKVIATDGTTTTLTNGIDYVIGGLKRKYINLLQTGAGSLNSVLSVEYSSGNVDPSDVNLQVKEGILTILSENFENRMEGLEGGSIWKDATK